MAEMREAAPRTVKLTEMPPQTPKEFTFGSRVRNLKNTGRIAVLSTFLGAAVVACGGGNQRVNVPPTHEAGTPGVDVVRMTPTGIPSETATVTDFLTATAKAQETKTSQETATAESTKTPTSQEINQPGPYKITYDSELTSQTLPSGETIEQYRNALQQAIDQIPKIGNPTIKIFMPKPGENQDSEYFYTEKSGAVFLISANYPDIETAKSALYHEFGHYFDPELNGLYLEKIMTKEDLTTLEDLRQQAINDPVFGIPEDHITINLLDNPQMAHSFSLPPKDADRDWLIEYNKKYPIGLFLSGRTSPHDATQNPIIIMNENAINDAREIAKRPGYDQRAGFTSETDFFNNPLIQQAIDELSQKYPNLKLSFDEFKANKYFSTSDTIALPGLTPSNFSLAGETIGDWLIANATWEPVMEAETNPNFLDTVPIQDQANIKQFVETSRRRGQNELLANQAILYFGNYPGLEGTQNPIAPIISLAAKYNNR